MIGGFFSFGLIWCPILRLVYTARISIPFFRPSSPSCLRAELADLWSLKGNTILTGASFTLHARVEIASPETFLVTKLLMVDCSSWAGYWSREKVCVRRSHSRWNSCQVDDTLKARSSKCISKKLLITILIPWRKASPYHQQSTWFPQSKVFHQLILKMSSKK